ncbi:polysaccharide deacetylase family protein [Bacillus tianshenii]|nr:polysaccharide deacetylase family protein [Bacillus tianshenii]
MRKHVIQLVGFAVLLMVTFGVFKNPYIDQFALELMESRPAFKADDALYHKITEEAPKYEEAPVDARIDRVWKALPGYNGLVVDMKKSYEAMRKTGKYDEKLLQFKEVPPAVKLKNLPPSPVYRGHAEKPMISFIINVAWGNEYLPEMLKVLKKHNVHATFFFEGRWVKNNPELTTMIHEAGHEIGNHSYSHPNMANMTKAAALEELRKTNEVIEATLNVKPEWFGPPSGAYNQQTVEAAAELGMRTVMWSVDTVDWKKPEPAVMVERVAAKLHPGAMILMHPTASTAAGLEGMIQAAKAKEYKIDVVSTLLSEQRVSVESNGDR